MIAKIANAENICFVRCSLAYNAANFSSRKLYSSGPAGLNASHCFFKSERNPFTSRVLIFMIRPPKLATHN
jgi:hypothetical protein